MQKRQFTRVHYSECASIKHNAQVFFGYVKNISLQGLFITTDQPIPLNDVVEVTVYQPPCNSFRMQANVVRCEDSGLGVRINKLDVNSFVHLRDILATNCDDYELIINETYKVAGCIN